MDPGDEQLDRIAAALGIDFSMLAKDSQDDSPGEEDEAVAAARAKRKEMRTVVRDVGLVKKKARKC